MARLKILFADDQIPDEGIPDEKITKSLEEQHPEWNAGFINAFVAMRQSVKTLRGAGYDVVTVSNYRDALKLVKHSHFDIAIVDLGWFADASLTPDKKEYGGWDICESIDDADKISQSKRTAQIIFSNRFDEDASVSMQAADSGKLPVFKNYSEATHQVLRASIKFIENYLSNPSTRELAIEAVRAFRQTVQTLLNEALTQERRWTTMTIGLVTLSVILILAGAFAAILGYAQAGTLTSISSVITSAVSILLFRELRKAQENTKNSLKVAEQNYRDAMKQLLNETEPKS